MVLVLRNVCMGLTIRRLATKQRSITLCRVRVNNYFGGHWVYPGPVLRFSCAWSCATAQCCCNIERLLKFFLPESIWHFSFNPLLQHPLQPAALEFIQIATLQSHWLYHASNASSQIHCLILPFMIPRTPNNGHAILYVATTCYRRRLHLLLYQHASTYATAITTSCPP